MKDSTPARIIPFRQDRLLLVEHAGEPFVPMKPVVQGMGLAWQSQHEKLRTRFRATITEIVIVAEDGRRREMTSLPLRKLPGWLMSVNPDKVRPELRENIIAYQNECDDVLWAYWNEGIAVRTGSTAAANILSSTIGTDGFHVLGALVAGKVRGLPAQIRRRATMKLWAQVHAAFNVRSAEDIPVNQLDSARNFVAAYALEGELLDREQPPAGRHVPMATIYNAYALVRHFDALADLFKERRLYEHLSGLGSDLGGLMIDRFKDGRIFSHHLKREFAPEMGEFERRIGEGRAPYELH